jgi:hypothetical protein
MACSAGEGIASSETAAADRPVDKDADFVSTRRTRLVSFIGEP